jgi:ketosteroid isomerase-like protein
MAYEHSNVSLIKSLDLRDLAAATTLFAQDVVWHFFNPLLQDVQGDYVGLSGIRTFFEKIGAITDGTFRVQPISVTAVGDELVVTQTKNSMTMQGQPIVTDVVVVWRIVDGRIAEVWDIPSVHTSTGQI